jgi:hypothetical protein
MSVSGDASKSLSSQNRAWLAPVNAVKLMMDGEFETEVLCPGGATQTALWVTWDAPAGLYFDLGHMPRLFPYGTTLKAALPLVTGSDCRWQGWP